MFASELGSAYRISVNKGLDKNQNIPSLLATLFASRGGKLLKRKSVQKRIR